MSKNGWESVVESYVSRHVKKWTMFGGHMILQQENPNRLSLHSRRWPCHQKHLKVIVEQNYYKFIYIAVLLFQLHTKTLRPSLSALYTMSIDQGFLEWCVFLLVMFFILTTRIVKNPNSFRSHGPWVMCVKWSWCVYISCMDVYIWGSLGFRVLHSQTPLGPQAKSEANLDRLRLLLQWECLKCTVNLVCEVPLI